MKLKHRCSTQTRGVTCVTETNANPPSYDAPRVHSLPVNRIPTCDQGHLYYNSGLGQRIVQNPPLGLCTDTF